ncbi:hypothetical protein EV383_4415 [Pseudonocardia sediminis]|uniref:Uncharacterized protein n=1 Tax=Pseudonocardia sediminis TaxID=1397368 RepID=A0A4V2FRB2_PSEST|nr:hypothetical protein EV383_4415 [Pseudonocardia sediminis]
MNLHEERYSGSDADPMSAPYLSRLDEEDEDWERTWGPRDQAS